MGTAAVGPPPRASSSWVPCHRSSGEYRFAKVRPAPLPLAAVPRTSPELSPEVTRRSRTHRRCPCLKAHPWQGQPEWVLAPASRSGPAWWTKAPVLPLAAERGALRGPVRVERVPEGRWEGLAPGSGPGRRAGRAEAGRRWDRRHTPRPCKAGAPGPTRRESFSASTIPLGIPDDQGRRDAHRAEIILVIGRTVRSCAVVESASRGGPRPRPRTACRHGARLCDFGSSKDSVDVLA